MTSGMSTPTFFDVEKSASISTPDSTSSLSGVTPLSIRELDENGRLCTIYESRSSNPDDYSSSGMYSRSINSSQTGFQSIGILQFLINIFLPTGYPHSVTPDYFDYQIYDSFQAFSSSIASLFANRAVLSAVGVGDQSATSTSALFMKIIQETIGRLGTICFAWKFGSALEPECKKYRFMADIVNDSAMVFDCLSPMFPFDKKVTVGMLCMSGLLRSICGVMAGGSRAALTQHFTDPNRGSIADVNAKDQSQETVISLMGMLAGSVVVGIVKGEGAEMWCVVIVLLSLHLWTNYKAVSSVVLKGLNRQRSNIVFADIHRSLHELKQTFATDVDTDRALSKLILSPNRVARRENILEQDGILRNSAGAVVGYGSFGTFEIIRSGAHRINVSIPDLVAITKEWGYVIWPTVLSSKHTRVHITLLQDDLDSSTGSSGDLRAWVHAYLIAVTVNSTLNGKGSVEEKASVHDPLTLIQSTAATVSVMFDELKILPALKLAGWDFSSRNILTHPVRKIIIEQ